MGIDASAGDLPDGPKHGLLQGRAFVVLRVAITLAIVAGLIVKLSPAKLGATLRDAEVGPALAAFALMFVVQALVIAKWRWLLAARDVRAPLAQLVRVYCVGNLLTTVLPTAVGGDVYRVYRLQRDTGARAADVTMSVLYERATGYGAMTCLGALGAAFYYGEVAIGVLALALGALGAVALALVLPRVPFPAIRQDHFLRNLMAHRRELIAVYQMVIFSVLIQALYISTIALLGRSLGVHVSWSYWALVTWIVAVATLLPLTLGGLGVRESSFSALLRHADATAAQGASTGFALGVLFIVVNAVGLLAAEAAQRRGYGAARPAERADSPAALNS